MDMYHRIEQGIRRTCNRVKGAGIAVVVLSCGLSLLALDALAQEQYARTIQGRMVIDEQEEIRGEREPEIARLGSGQLMSVSDFAVPELMDRISMNLRDVTVGEALQEVQRQTNLKLSYGTETVAVGKQITRRFEAVTAGEALHELLQGTGLQLMVSRSGQVVVYRRSERAVLGEAYRPMEVVINRPAAIGVRRVPTRMQTGTIRGTVTDSTNGEPLPGVNVSVEGTQQGAATGVDGQYVISGLEPGTYSVAASFVGYADVVAEGVTVAEDQTTTVDFVMRPSAVGLDDVVVIGYGTAESQDVAGSVGSVDVLDQTETGNMTNLGELLQGQVSGLNAGVATGMTGETNLEVRGRNSIMASNDPLIVLDGMIYYGSISSINPYDIQSIDVLKGASAAAVYGASAAAGVIEVTTKQGSSPEPTINFTSTTGLATPGAVQRPFGPAEYLDYMKDMAIRVDPGATQHYYADPRNLPSGISLEEWKALGSGSGSAEEIWLSRIGLSNMEINNFLENESIDWHGQVYRQATLRTNQNLSVSGQTNDVSYYWSLGYVDNKGKIAGERFRNVRSRLNLAATIQEWLDVSVNSSFEDRDEGYLGANESQVQWVSPYGNMYADDGSLEWYPHDDQAGQNPFLWTSMSGRRLQDNSTRLNVNMSADVTGLPLGLNYRVRWGNQFSFGKNYLFNPSTVPWGTPAGNASRSEYTSRDQLIDNILKWNQTVADIHEFDLTALYGIEIHNDWTTVGSSEEFPVELLNYSGLHLGGTPSVNSQDTRSTGTTLMGRMIYQLMDRYIVNASYRRDGFSAFGQSHPYGYFPSLALAWRISEEPFFDFDPISNLKLRGSWGKNGNRSIGTYVALQRMNTVNYIYDVSTVTGLSAENLANQNLKWETTTQYNTGIDFGLYNNRVSGSVDAYYMSTRDLLLERSLPNLTGYSNIWSNLGQVVNRGLEFELRSTNVLSEDFRWSSAFTFSLNRNEIKHLYGTQVPVTNDAGEIVGYREADDRQSGWFIGHALNEIYDYEVLGVWQEDEAEEAAMYGMEPGDFKLNDVNGDGVLTPIEDKQFLGYTKPRYRLSLKNNISYGNFGGTVLLTSHLGQYGAHNIHKHAGWRYGRANTLDYPYWTPENPSNEFARLASTANPNFTYWENNSFLKLQSISLSYAIPDRLVGRAGIGALRVFFNARNVFSLSGWDGADPETLDATPRLYTLGVNVSI